MWSPFSLFRNCPARHPTGRHDMEEWKDRGIVLAVGHFGETHIWLRILFRRKGLHTVFAFGGAASRKRFCGCLDILNTLDCLVRPAKNGEYLVLAEATLLNGPKHLRHDWQSLGILQNCLLFLRILGVTPDSAAECFAIISDLAQYLENGTDISSFMPIFFRLRIGGALGYAPNFQTCGDCGRDLEAGTFLADEGRIYCPACLQNRKFGEKSRSFPLNNDSLKLCQRLLHNLPSAFDLRDAPAASLRQCANAIDGFVEYHMGIIWDKGTFQRT